MASEQVDGGMTAAGAEAEATLCSTASLPSDSSPVTERFPANAVLPDGKSPTYTAFNETTRGSESASKDVSTASSAILDGSEDAAANSGAANAQVSMESEVEPKSTSFGSSVHDIGMDSQGGSSSIDKSAASVSMSSSSSSNHTSSTSSGVVVPEPMAQQQSPSCHSDIHNVVPPPSSFVQKRDNANQVPKRQRIPRACDACRRKKIRCNLSSADSPEGGHEQACANCHQSGISCTFTKTVAKRGPNKGYIQQLENRLAALESSVSSETSPDQTASKLELSDRPRLSQSHSHSILPPASIKNSGNFSLPPQKVAHSSNTLPPQVPQDFHHPLQILPSHPFSARTASNETWSRTTAPPTLLSNNSFFLSSHPSSSTAGHPGYRDLPHHSPPSHVSDASRTFPPKSTLPPISQLISTLPASEKHLWPQRDSQYLDSREAPLAKRQRYNQPHESEQNGTLASAGKTVDYRHEAEKIPSTRQIPSRQPSYSSSHRYTDYVQSVGHSDAKSRAPHRDHISEARSSYYSSETSHVTRSPSGTSPAGYHQSISDASPKMESRLRWPSNSATPSVSPQGSASVLSRLDRSAVLSLDSPAFRKAVFTTPAMRTFAILPPVLLEEGFQGCQHLIKAAHLLSTSSATLALASDTFVDQQWDHDSSAVIGECMMPMRFDGAGSNMTCREIETLMMCYVDALRRGKLIAGILGAISGKLAILETRGVPCKRYQAVGILLAVWHTVGYSSRRMYFGTPSTSGPEALYTALDTNDPTILAMCIFTYNLDKMCRRYCQNGETYVPPESIEFTRVIAASLPEPLPKAQLRLLSSLDSFLLALNFAYNQSLTGLPSIEALERQRHQLHSIVHDADSSDLLNLLVGPHVLAMASCAALYCLAACREKGESETEADQKQNIRTLERDYLSILDALRNMTTALSATPDASLVNSHPFADGGDMRLLYAQIANFVKVNLAAAISSSKEQLTASQVIGNLHSMGYLGTILAASQASESHTTV